MASMSDAGAASWAASFSPPAKTAGLDALMLCDPRILCPIRSYQILSGPIRSRSRSKSEAFWCHQRASGLSTNPTLTLWPQCSHPYSGDINNYTSINEIMPSIQQNAWLIGNTASLSIMMILKAVLHKEQHFLVAVIEPLLLLKRG